MVEDFTDEEYLDAEFLHFDYWTQLPPEQQSPVEQPAPSTSSSEVVAVKRTSTKRVDFDVSQNAVVETSSLGEIPATPFKPFKRRSHRIIKLTPPASSAQPVSQPRTRSQTFKRRSSPVKTPTKRRVSNQSRKRKPAEPLTPIHPFKKARSASR